MSTPPALNYMSNAARNEGELKQALEDLLASIKQMPGAGVAETTLTIASDAIMPPGGGPGVFKVDTEAAASADNLSNIIQTNFPDGSFIMIRAANAAHVVTVKTGIGGAGGLVLAGGLDVVLDDVKKWVCLKRSGTLWEEVWSPTLLAPTLKNALVSADPTVNLGVASKQYVDNSVTGAWSSVNQTSKNNAGTPNTQFDLDADSITLRNPSTGTLVTRFNPGAALTNNTATAGSTANGRDQAGAFGAGFVHFYWIWNGTTLATLSSNTPPPNGPTLPSTYTHWCYAGAVYYTGTVLASVRILGNKVWYETEQLALSSGSATTETGISLGALVPPNALTIVGYVKHQITCAAGAANYRLTLRVITAKDFQVFGIQATSQDASGTVLEYGQAFVMPNIAQNIYYLFTVSAGSSPLANVLIQGYEIPNGAN